MIIRVSILRMVAQAAHDAPPYPSRFFAAPERGRRIGRPLRLLARVRSLDVDLLDRIGRRMYARDELGALLVGAMRRDRAEGERVRMAQFHQALEHGIDSVPGAPEPLRKFFAEVDQVPGWVDFDLLERGARAIRRMGHTAGDVMLQLALIGGYRFGGPADLLVETGGLTGSTALRRLGETKKWAVAVSQPGAMHRDGEGFKLTVHVRAMHALVNDRFERNGRWDVRRWGLPINQSDQAATLGLFNSTLLLGVRALGWVVTTEESRAVMHLWKYVGWLMGVDEDWLFDTEREQNAFNYHILRVQDDQTPAGAALSSALVEGQLDVDHGRFGRIAGRYARLRLLSMLRYFLGKRDMRDLQLPVTPAWALPGVVATNAAKSGLLARTRRGRRYLERAGDRVVYRDLRKMFGSGAPEIGALPA